MGNKSSDEGSSKIGTMLNSSVYLLHKPQQLPPQVELVFIHGLQHGDFRDAYWKTWLARDGSDANCWPSTWLKQVMPRARILSLSYDSTDLRSATQGNEDMYALGEKLLKAMVLEEIGQNNCPVVFVCHSLGGLVAKEIVVRAWTNYGSDGSASDAYSAGAKSLLQNTKGFFFYATPHFGSALANLADKLLTNIPRLEKGLVVDYLRVLDKNTAILNNKFDQIHHQEYEQWNLATVGETHKTHLGSFLGYKMVVPESSARLFGVSYTSLEEDHMNVCKPKSPVDTSFRTLVGFVKHAVGPETELQLERVEILT